MLVRTQGRNDQSREILHRLKENESHHAQTVNGNPDYKNSVSKGSKRRKKHVTRRKEAVS